MDKTVSVIYPGSISGLERFLAHVSAEKLFSSVMILALPMHMDDARFAAEKHSELDCSVFEYPAFAEFPAFYSPEGLKRLDASIKEKIAGTTGAVIASGQTAPYAFLREIQALPLKPFYNYFRILKKLGVSELLNYTLNVLEKQRMDYILDDFAGMHEGERCFIVGNGPSLKLTDMSKLKDEITFGSNRVYLGFNDWGFKVKYWGILDNRQIETYCDEWEKNVDDDMIKFVPFEYARLLNFKNCCPVNTYHNANFPYPHNHFDPSRDKEDYLTKFIFSTNPDVVYLGWTVTYMLLQLAVIMGCNPIYLIGMDHKYNVSADERKKGFWKGGNATNHFHQDYAVNKQFNLPDEEMMEMFFDYAEDFCSKNGIKIYNASKETALHSFEKIDYDSLFTGEAPAFVADLKKKPKKDFDSHDCDIAVMGQAGQGDSIKNTAIKFLALEDKYNTPREINSVMDSVNADYLVVADRDSRLDDEWINSAKRLLDSDASVTAVMGTENADGKAYTAFGRFAPLMVRKSGLRFSEFYAVSLYKEDFCLRVWETGGKVACLPCETCGKEEQRKDEVNFKLMDETLFMKQWRTTGRYEKVKAIIGQKCDGDCFVVEDIASLIKPKIAHTAKADLPSVMTLLVVERLRGIANTAQGRVLVFGAGLHTQWLEKIYGIYKGLPQIEAVLDDSIDNKPDYFGVKPSLAAEYKIGKNDVIILSSDCHQSVMAKRCSQLFGNETVVVDLYHGLPTGPHDKA